MTPHLCMTITCIVAFLYPLIANARDAGEPESPEKICNAIVETLAAPVPSRFGRRATQLHRPESNIDDSLQLLKELVTPSTKDRTDKINRLTQDLTQLQTQLISLRKDVSADSVFQTQQLTRISTQVDSLRRAALSLRTQKNPQTYDFLSAMGRGVVTILTSWPLIVLLAAVIVVRGGLLGKLGQLADRVPHRYIAY